MNWTTSHAKLHQYLKDKNLLPSQSKILIALSGGQDSLCLTKLFLDLQSKWSWNLAIAHYDHNWSQDKGLANHIQKIAENWQLPIYIETATQKMDETEAEARKYRYQALIKIAEIHNFNYIITGHTMSDKAETLIYNLIRGAGSDGLSALNWERNLTEKIKLIRPLLNFSREETLEFCQQFNLPIWEDIYNTQKKYARNRIRLDLIPYLKTQFNPQVETQLAQTSELLKADVEYLEIITNNLFEEVFNPLDNTLNRQKIRQYHLALQRRIIKKFLEKNLTKQPNFEQIEAVIKLIHAPNKTKTSSFHKNLIIQVEKSFIIITKPEN